MPKVSVIVPIFNVEDYVIKSVNSVISQTEKDIEIILVDDGSTDNSGKICDDFAEKDKRVKIIHKKNGGLSSARNAGVNIATGDFVLFLDGDDYLRNDAVEILLRTAQKYPSDFIQFNWQEIEKDAVPVSDNTDIEIYQAHKSNELFKNLYKIGGVAASACTKFFKREFIKDKPYKSIRHEDEMWCSDAFKKDLTVTYINDKLYYYVVRSGSIIHGKFNKSRLELFDVIEYRLKTLEELNLIQFYEYEYKKLFFAILGLYCEARTMKDQDAVRKIKTEFKRHKRNLKKYAKLSGKYKLINSLMRLNFNFVNLYYFYRKRSI